VDSRADATRTRRPGTLLLLQQHLPEVSVRLGRAACRAAAHAAAARRAPAHAAVAAAAAAAAAAAGGWPIRAARQRARRPGHQRARQEGRLPRRARPAGAAGPATQPAA